MFVKYFYQMSYRLYIRYNEHFLSITNTLDKNIDGKIRESSVENEKFLKKTKKKQPF